mmetsp:Transcript_22953/g.26177  ORF Transcript_22953/g.26177 Transcript_22953/m.26177 type:complete len:206 (+) Transcript_22953:168-785(+)|eukprot:CAMPEP_0194132126 /NCGR_PEP_ID=MMETSP0152-20130528/2670_1 /TAXON_ID=1049557 /ORGANISM="Thalassiothrix antarctica, Strain L6-D1" /LENGTH=205 /DNA_ID=CAMNT_0038827073 /DNA_START=104 /DNA_END=721 /DNA_ORIENTATION=-
MKILSVAVLLLAGRDSVTSFSVPVTRSTSTTKTYIPCTTRRLVKTTKENDTEESQQQFDFTDPLSPVVFGEKLVIPFTKISYDLGTLQNDGQYSWLVPYTSLIGYKAGNTLVGGIPKEASTKFSEEEKIELRRKAASELVNISDDERALRGKYSTYLYAAAASYAVYSSVILDDGGFGGHLIRFVGLFPLLVIGRGYQLSSQFGL